MEIINYSSLEVGERFYSSFNLTYEMIEDFIEVVDECIEIPKDGKVPNFIFALYKPVHEAMGKLSQGTIHVQQKMEHFSTAYIEDELDVVVTVRDKFNRREKAFLIIEVDFIHKDRLICRHETTHIWSLAREEKSNGNYITQK